MDSQWAAKDSRRLDTSISATTTSKLLEVEVQKKWERRHLGFFYGIVLRVVRRRWVQVIQEQERYHLKRSKSSGVATADLRLEEKEFFDEYLKRGVNLLKADLLIIDHPPIQFPMDDLKRDYTFMLEKGLGRVKQNASTIPIITAIMAVKESRKAIEQANDVK